MNARLRRLYADYQQLRNDFTGHPYVDIRPLYGNPPEAYEVVYHVRGLALDQRTNRPVVRTEHRVKIYLHRDYPRQKPKCVLETPIFHPNFGSYICIDDYWAAGETLSDVIVQIGQMIQYQSYNPKSPLNPVAARWGMQNEHLFPIGKAELYQPDIDIDLIGQVGSTGAAEEDIEIELM